MDPIHVRKLSSLEYGDPTGFLRELRKVEERLGPELAALPERMRRLRTNALKPCREMRDAALFCHGMSERMGRNVFLSPTESEDYDFVATWFADDVPRFRPVQLKELVPAEYNPSGSLDHIVAGLARYADASSLTVAVRLNRAEHFAPGQLRLTNSLRLGGLWVFGCISDDQSKWGLWGDFVSQSAEPFGTEFKYPE